MDTPFSNNRQISYSGLTCKDPLLANRTDWSFMLNGCTTGPMGKTHFRHMYKGNKKVTSLTDGYRQVGAVKISHKRICIFSANTFTGGSEIGIFNGKRYDVIVNDNRLGFRVDRQIQAVVDEDYNKHVTVVWVQKDAPIRYMDLNQPPIIDGVLDIDALDVFKKYSYPQLTFNEVTSGGRLLAGCYYFSLQYADENGNGLSGWSTLLGPIPIYRDSINQPKHFVNGSADREPTSKAIKLLLSNLDNSFKYINIGVVKSYNGIRSAVLAATVPVYQTNYLYVGNVDIERPLPISDIVTPGVSYYSASTIALTNKQILLGNLKGRSNYNLQPYISRIALQWQVVKEKQVTAENTYANPYKSLYELQFRRNEIYNLGIVIRWKDGSKSRVFPLTGRRMNHNALGTVISKSYDEHNRNIPIGQWDSMALDNDKDIFEQGTVPPRWKTHNTAYVIGDDLVGEEGASLYGEFGYWESEDRYPNDARVWGEDAGLPIRHFKMPDINVAPLIDGEDEMRTDKDIVSIYKLGLRFINVEEVMASLPEEVKSQMDGWELVRADRRNNKSILASGIIHNMLYQNWADSEEASNPSFNWLSLLGGATGALLARPGRDTNESILKAITKDVRLYPNYPHNDLRPDPYIDANPIDDDKAEGSNHRYRKDVFTLFSPDTSFNKDMLFNGELLIHKEVYGISKVHSSLLNPFPALKDVGDDSDDVAYQFSSVGHYNAWKKTTPGNLRRQIKECMYIPFNSQVPGGAVGVPIHNLTRESSLMVATETEVDDPTVIDTSRPFLRDSDFNCEVSVQDRYRTVSAYYVSIVSRIANQYGSIYDGRYCYTNYDHKLIKKGVVVFGGDSYIGAVSIKRQMAMYQNLQTFMDWEDGKKGVDLKSSETIFNTHYHYLAARRNTNRDSLTQCETSNRDLGVLPSIISGVPVVYCESDYNMDLRLNGTEEWNTYYPNLKDGSMNLDEFLGVEHLDKDNEFLHNNAYSEINDLNTYEAPDPFFNPDNLEETAYTSRVIYSLQTKAENRFNNLLVFLPLNYYDFQRDSGELIDIRDIGSYTVFFRFEHALYVDRLYATIDTQGINAKLGNGKLFDTAPQALVKTDGGWVGTYSQWCFNTTPFGSFFIDAERKSVLLYSGGINDIAAIDMHEYFNEHLELRLAKDLPFFTAIDNPCNPEGIGFHSVWDNSNKLWLLTKRDYYVLDRDSLNNFSMSADGKILLNSKVVSLQDNTIFGNCSYTISYHAPSKRWNGWHSFIPTNYQELDNKYYSCIDSNIWLHDEAVPRSYYGKMHPFVVEDILKDEAMTQKHLHALSYISRCFNIKDNREYGERVMDTFNKGVIYNIRQSSGNIQFTVQDENKLSTINRPEINTLVYNEVFLRKRSISWGFSRLNNNVVDASIPFFNEHWGVVKDGFFIDKEPDNSNMNYGKKYEKQGGFNDLWCKCRMIYDKEDAVQLYLYSIISLDELVTN